MPTNLEGASNIIKTLPKQDVYILDQTNEELKEYPSVHQNFIKDIYEALNYLLEPPVKERSSIGYKIKKS